MDKQVVHDLLNCILIQVTDARSVCIRMPENHDKDSMQCGQCGKAINILDPSWDKVDGDCKHEPEGWWCPVCGHYEYQSEKSCSACGYIREYT